MSYELLISSIAEVHARTQTGAAGAVNRYLTLRNWFIGAYAVQFEQNGADRASYGQQLLVHLARDLWRRRIPGCSPEMLGRMRVFYRAYPHLGENGPSLGENGPSLFTTESDTSSAPTQIEISSPVVTKTDTALPTPLGGQTLLRLSWSHLPGARHVRVALAPGISASADRSRAMALRSRCHRRAGPRCRGVGRTERGGLAGIRLDRGGLLVYGLDLVRQSRDYDRTVSEQHFFRYCACSCRRVHRVATVWSGCGPSPGKVPSIGRCRTAGARIAGEQLITVL
jgi:DUF1016 N-terminal domain